MRTDDGLEVTALYYCGPLTGCPPGIVIAADRPAVAVEHVRDDLPEPPLQLCAPMSTNADQDNYDEAEITEQDKSASVAFWERYGMP